LLTNDSVNNNNVMFWGFFDTANTYTQITLRNTSNGDRFGFDDMVIGDQQQVTPGATPLPAAFPLFATGIGGLGLLGWRRKKRAAARAA
jgi:hypothetical protein